MGAISKVYAVYKTYIPVYLHISYNTSSYGIGRNNVTWNAADVETDCRDSSAGIQGYRWRVLLKLSFQTEKESVTFQQRLHNKFSQSRLHNVDIG